MKKLDTNIFIGKNNEEKYSIIFSQAKKLGKSICKTKKIELNSNNIFEISDFIYYNSICFENYYYLCKMLLNYQEYSFTTINVDEFQDIIKLYNELLNELIKYNDLKKLIDKEGFEILKNKYKKNLKTVFLKMLNYKNRKYNKDNGLIELLEEIDLCYHDYNYLWTPLYQLLKENCIYKDTIKDEFWKVKSDKVEFLSMIKDTYELFNNDENLYKNYSALYEEITLEENQSIQELYQIEEKKLKELYVNILKNNDKNINNDANRNLEYEIEKIYPNFEDIFLNLENTRNDVHSSYIDLIDQTRKTYKLLNKILN